MIKEAQSFCVADNSLNCTKINLGYLISTAHLNFLKSAPKIENVPTDIDLKINFDILVLRGKNVFSIYNFNQKRE